jgi:hypothetical protein
MKNVLKIIFFMLATFVSVQSQACDFEFKVVGEIKSVYKVGDEIIVIVTVKLSHRVCHETLDEVKFNFSGLKVLGATKWTEITGKEFERKFKLQVVDEAKATYTMSASRSCDKDGGRGSIAFNVK